MHLAFVISCDDAKSQPNTCANTNAKLKVFLSELSNQESLANTWRVNKLVLQEIWLTLNTLKD